VTAAIGIALLALGVLLSAHDIVRAALILGGVVLVLMGGSRIAGDRKAGAGASSDGVQASVETPTGYTETETLEKTGLNPEGKSPIPPTDGEAKSPADPGENA
jgi:hypothetical protein